MRVIVIFNIIHKALDLISVTYLRSSNYPYVRPVECRIAYLELLLGCGDAAMLSGSRGSRGENLVRAGEA